MAKIPYQSHITILEAAAAAFPSCNAFKIPVYDESGEIIAWNDVTYKQFYSDVESMAAYWIATLGLPFGSIVAVRLDGTSYPDVVTFFSISRAGYVLQTMGLSIDNPALVSEMLAETNACVLISDASCGEFSAGFSVPVYPEADVKSLADVPDMGILPPLANIGNADDIIMFFYTSGSTSGRPRLIPYSRKFVHGLVIKLSPQTPIGPVRPITTSIGVLIHAAQFCQFISQFPYGPCHILVRLDFPSNVLIQMVEQCGLTKLSIFSNRLTKHLKNAHSDPRLLSVLQSIEINCTGGQVPKNDIDWAYENGLHVVITFGMTQTGALLTTGNARGEKPVGYRTLGREGYHHTFVPVENASEMGDEKLLELVVLSDSPDCPDVFFRAADGHYHSGDTFVEISPQRYASRGRVDDQIKLYAGGLCNAGAIEEQLNQRCSTVITDCIVVGSGRSAPALIVEANSHILDIAKIIAEVAQSVATIQKGHHQFERIASNRILVVETGTLPRTVSSGNIRRGVVEQQFKGQLDELDS
ncbi:acetyl-CoA synthetase-like protein [Hysterangium stoloniferum]|nr:acetyl-CoA synthetase-like protein [Hysterangium stoloniferum]